MTSSAAGQRAKFEEEVILFPDLPICDAHHHLWDHPGDRYLLLEICSDLAAGHNVTSTVFVECQTAYLTDEPVELRPIGETIFAANVAAESRSSPAAVCAAIVGFADLTLGDQAKPVLEAHIAAGDGRFRGVRHVAMWDADPEVVGSTHIFPRGLYLDTNFRRGFAHLAPLGLTFDAWAFQTQLAEIIDLACAFPDQPIIMNHLGGVLGVRGYAERKAEMFDQWRTSVRRLSECKNVSMKIGGFGLKRGGFGFYERSPRPGSDELAVAWAPWIETCIDFFGADRCMFESNFPVDNKSCSYIALWNAFKRVTESLSGQERAALFHDNAVRVYHVDEN